MNDKNRVFSNVIWRFFERCGAQVITFILTTVLARLLAPEEYGTVSLVVVFTSVMQVFVDSGMGNALIQKKHADEVDFSTVFYFNAVTSVGLYALMYLAAPLIAGFYGIPDLISIVRVLSLTLIISGVRNIQQAYVARNLLYKRFFFSTLAGTLISGIVGIWMAYNGFGVWAMVVRQLLNAAVDAVILWLTVKWRPIWSFSMGRLKVLFSFGWKILATSLLDTLYSNMRQMIIGKLYTTADLAFNNKGKQLPELVVTNVNTAIDGVLLPTMSAEQEDIGRVGAIMRRAIKTSMYFLAPLLIGLAFVAEPVVRLLLTEKWLCCVPFLRIFCAVYLLYPIQLANRNAIKAIGRSDLVLKMEVVNKLIGLLCVLCSMWFGVLALTFSLLVSSLLGQIIIMVVNHKMFGYRYRAQITDVLPSLLVATIMGGCVSCISIFCLGDVLTLALQVILGAAIYIACSAALKLEAYTYSMGLLRPYLQKITRKNNRKAKNDESV